jgi:hypothetical protein
MVAVFQRGHDVGWLTPAPMWSGFGALTADAQRQAFLRPAILRFAHDAFMDELMATLAYHPEKLGEWRAAYETWEKPMAAPPSAASFSLREPVSKLSVRLIRGAAQSAATSAGVTTLPANLVQVSSPPLKLYQPVQQRHYLVTASLVCRTPGLPDRRIDAGKQERAAYVLRRIVLPDGVGAPSADPRTWDEYGFVDTAAGPAWQRAKGAGEEGGDTLLPGEERLPLFSVGFNEDNGRKRRLFAGLIPVGRREVYVNARVRSDGTDGADGAGATTGSGTAAEADADPRLLLFQMRVTGPWSELVQQSLDEGGRLAKKPDELEFMDEQPLPSDAPPADFFERAREQAQTVSWYALLDFERFLFDHLPRVWEVLTGTRQRDTLDAQTEEPLVDWLERVVLDPTLKSTLGAQAKSSLLQALTLMAQDQSIGEGLERVEVAYRRSGPDPDWPDFLFPLADAGARGPFPFSVGGVNLATARPQILEEVDAAFAELAKRITAALPPRETAALPEIHVPSNPKIDTGTAWFAIRCVYERPNCGPFDPPAVSEPTQPFQMASFFDPEAPARPVRIPMPFDISPAGLRKFNKSATLQVSDMLCGQLKRIRKMTLGDLVLSVLPWPFHKDLPDPSGGGPCEAGGNRIGMFCSLSIPIVTICALILLIIIVSLFDLFFRWLPYLFLCLPIPGFKGKRS